MLVLTLHSHFDPIYTKPLTQLMSVRLSHVSATVLVPSESLLISGLDLSQLKALDRPQDHPLPNDVSKVPAIVGCCT